MGQQWNAYGTFVENPEGKKSVRTPSHKLEGNIKIDTISLPSQCNLSTLYVCSFFFLFTTCFGLSRPSSGVTSQSKAAILYRMAFLFLVSLFTSYIASPTTLTLIKIALFKIICFKIKIIIIILKTTVGFSRRTRRPGVSHVHTCEWFWK
jgi:hypothetical protein